MVESVAISRIHFPVTTLGPGHRIGIWFQGCSIRCPGCISTDTWDRNGESVPFVELWNVIDNFARDADGVTITGGEPFDQADALRELLHGLRTRLSPIADVLVYSGFSSSVLAERLHEMTGLIDAIISEPFDAEAPQTQALMGSDNQRLHFLTPLGERRFHSYRRPRNTEDDRLDLIVDSDGTGWLAGIPKRGDLEHLRRQLAADGTFVRTSEQRTTPS